MKYLLFIIAGFLCTPLLSQSFLSHIDAQAFSIPLEADSVEFLVFPTTDKAAKPALIFLQGSMPRPLIMGLDSLHHVNLPFPYTQVLQDYYLVLVTMPHTPIFAEKEHLNAQYNYITDPQDPASISKSYLADNYLENYVARTGAVIDFLRQQPWLAHKEIHLIGHSQGAKVAAVVASEDPDIATVSLLGFNPHGRFEEMIRRERKKLINGEIDSKDFLQQLRNYYEIWEKIHRDPESTDLIWSDPNKTWTSFSRDYVPYLLKMEQPLFVGYGTEDLIAATCDLLPLAFISSGKENLTLRPYADLEHNFFEVVDGQVLYDKGHWDEVLEDLLEWIEQNDTGWESK